MKALLIQSQDKPRKVISTIREEKIQHGRNTEFI